MTKDPENSKYQRFVARLFQSRFSTALIVGTAVVTLIAVIVFVKALPRRSRSPLTHTSELATTQAIAQVPAQKGEVQPGESQVSSSAASSLTKKEIRAGEEGRSPSAQLPDSLRNLSSLQQELDQIKQEQEKQIQTIASQLELITRHQESSLQTASKMAAQILELAQKAAAISTQHQESVRAIAAIEAKMVTSPGQAQEPASNSVPSSNASHDENTVTPGAPTATADSELANLHLAGVSAATFSNGCLQVKFDLGIFDRDDHLRIGAKARLQEVAKALVQSQQELAVYVVGLAYAEPNTWPWLEPRTSSEMALLRAVRVSTYLDSLGIFPRGAILPRAGSAEDLPFPPGDINNRTVLLRVFPRAYARR